MFHSVEDMSRCIAKAANEKKARDIVILDMKELTAETDYFIIASANNTLQARAIADNIEDELAAQGVNFLHKEGYRQGDWILLDYGDCVAHIFVEESRQFYNLEQLWGAAELTPYKE